MYDLSGLMYGSFIIIIGVVSFFRSGKVLALICTIPPGIVILMGAVRVSKDAADTQLSIIGTGLMLTIMAGRMIFLNSSRKPLAWVVVAFSTILLFKYIVTAGTPISKPEEKEEDKEEKPAEEMQPETSEEILPEEEPSPEVGEGEEELYRHFVHILSE